VFSDVVRGDLRSLRTTSVFVFVYVLCMYCICVFVGISRIFLPGILIFKGLTARRLYKSFGVKELKKGFRDTIQFLQTNAKAVCYPVRTVPHCYFSVIIPVNTEYSR
jgi:hypothetical protein